MLDQHTLNAGNAEVHSGIGRDTAGRSASEIDAIGPGSGGGQVINAIAHRSVRIGPVTPAHVAGGILNREGNTPIASQRTGAGGYAAIKMVVNARGLRNSSE